jgi:hypothetical protein
MMLLLRHDNRGEGLARWIDVYLTGLRARNLPADFQVVIDGVAGGALGDGSAPKLADWMIDRYNTEARSRDASSEAVEEWRQRLRSMAAVGDFAPTLAASCPDWAALRARHEANLMIEAALRHFQGRFQAGADVPADLTDRMRDLVAKLARTYDGPEERLRRDRWLEDFVAKTGDREEARRQLAAQEAGRTGSLNILSLVAASAYPASDAGRRPVPTVTELLTIVLSKDLIATAADMLYDSTSRPATVAVRVGRFPARECAFDCATDADVTREALLAQAAALEAEIRSQIKEEAGSRAGYAGSPAAPCPQRRCPRACSRPCRSPSRPARPPSISSPRPSRLPPGRSDGWLSCCDGCARCSTPGPGSCPASPGRCGTAPWSSRNSSRGSGAAPRPARSSGSSLTT